MAQRSYPTQLTDQLGNRIQVPQKPLAIGGEAAVFDVIGKPDLVAKLYHKQPDRAKYDKLTAMSRLASPDLLRIAAWPTTTLHAKSDSLVDGILMPKITGYQEIHNLYSVAQRKRTFAEVDWSFLVLAARNCASAFEVIHAISTSSAT